MKNKGSAQRSSLRSVAGEPRDESQRRAQIVDIAANLFASNGYARVSFKDVAEASGIQPASIYHHFPSKEAIAIELLEAYAAELDEIGRAASQRAKTTAPEGFHDAICSLGDAIADCSVRHHAALQLTMYAPPSGASERLVELSRHSPRAVQAAMLDLVGRAQARGAVKPDLDAGLVTIQLNAAMQRVGMAAWRPDDRTDLLARTSCRILLDGLASAVPSNAALDRSDAMRAADAVVRTWDGRAEPPAGDDLAARLRAAARSEFARRGYEATTVRDIAAAVGMYSGSIYRFVESKEALLAEIINGYHARLSEADAAVMSASSSIAEKLDALCWVHICSLDLFWEEFQIQLAWLRAVQPEARSVRMSNDERARSVVGLVKQGLRTGALKPGQLVDSNLPVDVFALCVRNLTWLPPSIVHEHGPRAALQLCRETILRGATPARFRGAAAEA